ncbi:MAG: HAD hydrolase-like protein [Treponema sp.]|jgi:beta-phosphoglucomutase-like phosphatase (HAD superfamily)|nr:HAD hydrolase-like protein [Treponema sp.]
MKNNAGPIDPARGWKEPGVCADGLHKAGENGVERILSTGDGKVELIAYADHTLAYVKSDMGYPAYYPLLPVRLKRPVKAVLMDLDGTTVRSESFWVWIIERSVASILGDDAFRLEAADLPFVSGHSVSEHLQYCIRKYAPRAALSDARAWYTEHTEREMGLILEGKGREDAFSPAPGIGEFLLALKERNIRIALVTSGLYRKAYPEILSAFQTLGLGKPEDFYDAFITAGFPLGKGGAGTLGELEAKPHPWLYAEACRVGLNIPPEDREQVIGIEDSAAGVCALRLAGYYTVGIDGGNIRESGALGMCHRYCLSFEEILSLIDNEDDNEERI